VSAGGAALLCGLLVAAGIPGERAEEVGAARLAAGDCAGAAAAYRAALAGHRTSERHLGLGRALLCLDQPRSAYAHLALVAEARGHSEPESLRALVDVLLRLGREDEARPVLDQLALHPGNARFVLRRRAVLRWRAGDLDRALDLARQAADGPMSGWDHRALCVLNLQRGDAADAVMPCRDALRRGAVGPEWLARALAALGEPERAARVLEDDGEDAARWAARLAARYWLAAGDLGDAAAALDRFRAAGGQAPSLARERAELGSVTRVAYRARGEARDGRYQGWAQGLVLDARVPTVGGVVLRPGVTLWHQSEEVVGGAGGDDLVRERGRADLELALSRRWPTLGLELTGGGGLSVLAAERLVPRLALSVLGEPGLPGRTRLALDVDYGLAERASGSAYRVRRVRARLAVRLALASLDLRLALDHRHYFLDEQSPREVRGDAELGWPVPLGAVTLVPALGLSLDRSWDRVAAGVPVDLAGDRGGGWLRLRLEAGLPGELAAALYGGWAPAAHGYAGGWATDGDFPWTAGLLVDWRLAPTAAVQARGEVRDEVVRRRFDVTLNVTLWL